MIPIPSGVRVWIATGHTDMRRGMNGCENAPNSDPIRVWCIPLINHVNRLASKGSVFARK